MKSYGQYCPMAMALEVLGDRWTLLIVREMLRGNHRFNDLARGLPGISRTLLSQRLRHLERGGIIERHVSNDSRVVEYRLTGAGTDLRPVVFSLVTWGTSWAFGDPQPEHLDPVLLMWWLKGTIFLDRLPPQRILVQFDFIGAVQCTLWLVLEQDDVSVCLQHPGFDVDLLVTADIATLYRVWGGRETLATAMRCDLVRLDGPPSLSRAFPAWLGWDGSTIQAHERMPV